MSLSLASCPSRKYWLPGTPLSILLVTSISSFSIFNTLDELSKTKEISA
jgi:hypothetical protein